VTFTPSINASSRAQPGRLRVREDPAAYVSRLQAEAAAYAERTARAQASAEASAMAECTFHPQVNEAPAYVKDIAKTMASLRQSAEPALPPARPEWRSAQTDLKDIERGVGRMMARAAVL
jgi:hypothetical protein